MQSKLLPNYASRTGKHQNWSKLWQIICTNKSDMHTTVALVLALAILPNELFLLLIGYVSNSHAQFCGNCLLNTLYKSAITLPLQAGTAACQSSNMVHPCLFVVSQHVQVPKLCCACPSMCYEHLIQTYMRSIIMCNIKQHVHQFVHVSPQTVT